MEALLGLTLILALAMSGWFVKRRGDLALNQLERVRRERDEAQHALHNLETVVQNIDEAAFLIDRDEWIVFSNRAAQNLFATNIGQSFTSVAWQLQIQPLINKVLSQRAESLAQTVVKDERAFQVNVRACPPQSTGAFGAILLPTSRMNCGHP